MNYLKTLLKGLIGWVICYLSILAYFGLLIVNIWIVFNINPFIALPIALASFVAFLLILGAGINLIVECHNECKKVRG